MPQKVLNRITEQAQTHPDVIAIKGISGHYTWRQLWWAVNELSVVFKPLKNKIVALYADNSPEWIIADLAAAMSDIILLPLPTFFSSSQCNHALTEASADVLLCRELPGWLTQCLSPIDECQKISIGGEPWLMIDLTSNHDALIPPGCRKITFTSGSTGQPKGVCLSQEHQERVADSIVQVTQLSAGAHLTLLPLSTLLENVAGVYAPLLNGGEIICLPQHDVGLTGSSHFDVGQFIRVIDDYQPASMIMLPEMLSALLIALNSGWQAPATLQFIAIGGSKVAASLIEQAARHGLPVYEGYGLSECCSVISLNTPQLNQQASVGRALPHVELKIDKSEIVVSGNTCLGYLNLPESWHKQSFNTGDIGFFDQDGYLHIDGRKNNLLISSYGRNISPEWPESEVLANPMLSQCVVFGDARPYCCALIYPRSIAINNQQISQWLDYVNQLLPDYAQIKHWFRLPQPLTTEQGQLTANGRPKRAVIYKQFQTQIQSLYEEALDAIF